MLNLLLTILLICSIGFLVLAAIVAIVAIPGVARWSRRAADPMPIQVTVPLTLPASIPPPATADHDGKGDDGDSHRRSILAPPLFPPNPKPAAAIDVRFEPSTEIRGASSSAAPVHVVDLVIENIGDAPLFGLSIEPADERSKALLKTLPCAAALARSIPALAPGREHRLRAGERDQVRSALGESTPSVVVRFGTAFADESAEHRTSATIPVSTLALDERVICSQPPPQAPKPAQRNPFRPRS
ncbi:MAG: hypothetical protein ACTS3F_14795 [Phycisphaerales bacterium]